MTGGPISSKLAFISQYLESRAGGGGMEPDPLSIEEIKQVAGMLRDIVQVIGVMENQPVPARFKVINGGRG
jgi:hypothetical protein